MDKSVPEWGVDTAIGVSDNVRQGVANIGANNVDVVRLTFNPIEPLVDNGDGTYSLNQNNKDTVDFQLGIASMAGFNKPLALLPGGFDSTYDAFQWEWTIKATQEYINSKSGWTNSPIASIEAANEPDFWSGEPSPAQLNSLIAALKTYPEFQNTEFPAASTLNSDNAQWWYDQVPQATQGSSHLLGGSLTTWTNFIDYVNGDSKEFVNPEIHSMGEAIAGAEHGMASGIFWHGVLRGLGLFVQASDGDQLGYSENFADNSAGAVYRALDGNMYAFAGGLERDYFGSPSAFRFVCTNTDVYFNGIPVREYMLQTKNDELVEGTDDNDYKNFGSWSNQGAYADIDLDSNGVPALDGYRWKIVNRSTGKVMEVQNGSTSNGGDIQGATDTGALKQRWDIVRTQNGYYHFINANSQRTAEVEGFSLNDNANVQQWGLPNDIETCRQWYIEEVGNGFFYIKNANSHKYMTDSGSTINQQSFSTNYNRQWQFVLDPVSAPPVALYEFEGNANDSSGNGYHGTAFGSPSYPTGYVDQAINLDGGNDYVTLPAGVASSDDITVAFWVYWDDLVTSSSWQRLFDFGNNTTEYMFLTPYNDQGMMDFSITTGGTYYEQSLVTDPLPAGQWVHVALTLGGNTGILYLNGVPKVAGQILWNPSDFNPTNNLIGDSQWSGDPYFDGRIDDFRIYNYTLTADQIAQLFVPLYFTSDPISNTDGLELEPYSGQSLADFVNVPAGVTFSKDSEPNWLMVASDGTLSGTPKAADVGLNTFTVHVEDVLGQSDTAQMTILVDNLYNGTQGMDDLVGLVTEWLTLNCGLCNGADLDGDNDVTITDYSILAHNFLVPEELQLWLKFDEMAGTIANDNSIYWRAGLLVNSPVWTTDGAHSALDFDGSNYVEIPHDDGLNPDTDNWSVAFWMKSDMASQGALIVSKRENVTPYQGYYIGLSSGNALTFPVGSKLTFLFGADSGDRKGGYTTSDIVFNEWTHVCVVLDQDADTVDVYIDGVPVQVTHQLSAILPTINTTTGLYVGKNPGYASKPYTGLVDDVQIYNVALTEQEITELAQ